MKFVNPDVKIIPIADVMGLVYIAVNADVWENVWQGTRSQVGVVSSQIRVPLESILDIPNQML